MHAKRFLIATLIGALAGAFCAYGTKMSSDSGELGFIATTGIIGSVFYNRLLIGMFIGLLGNCKPHPVIKGAVAGFIVSLAMGITPLLDGKPDGAAIIVGAGVVYGIIIDVVASYLTRSKV